MICENDFVNTKAYDKAGNIAVKYESPYVTAPTSHIMTMAGSPGDVITVPLDDPTEAEYEAEVVRLVNVQRARYGLKPLESD